MNSTSTLNSRRATFPPSLVASPVVSSEDEGTATPAHPLSYLGAGRFYDPGTSDHLRRQLIGGRASWVRPLRHTVLSRPVWPSTSTRDLLKEAGEWLDIQYPLPHVPVTDTESQLSSSYGTGATNPALHMGHRPRSSACSGSPSSLVCNGSRPCSPLEEDVDASSEKVVCPEREARIVDLLGTMQTEDENIATGTGHRAAEIRNQLIKLQDQNEEGLNYANDAPEGIVELDVTVVGDIPRAKISRESSLSRTDGSIDEGPASQSQWGVQRTQRTNAYVNLLLDMDDQFSTAIAEALDCVSLQESEVSVTCSISEQGAATSTRFPKERKSVSSSKYILAQDPFNEPNTEIGGRTSKLDKHEDKTAVARTTSGSANHHSNSPVARLPQLIPSPPGLPQASESEVDEQSIFSDLENLVDAFQTRKRPLSKRPG